MRIYLFIVLIMLLVYKPVIAQEGEALTNSTVVMMVKANLSDELIIDEIKNSSCRFNLVPDSVKFLSGQHVSNAVLQAMMTVSGISANVETYLNQNSTSVSVNQQNSLQQSSGVITVSSSDTTKKEGETLGVQQNYVTNTRENTISKPQEPLDKTEISVTATGYTIPLIDLMQFFETEFSIFASSVQAWNKRISDSIANANRIMEKINLYEKDLNDKKNADAEGYSNVIIVLNKDLTALRLKYKQTMTNIYTDGMNIAKDCKNSGEKMGESVSSKFGSICSNIKKTNPDPVKCGIPKTAALAKQNVNSALVDNIASATQILYFCQNEIDALQELMIQWNKKVLEVVKSDSLLLKQLEPMKVEMEKYKQDSKKYKKEISDLKKEIAKIEKEREKLETQMSDDSKELAESLKKMGELVQNALKERFIDIVEDINFSYQDKFYLIK